MRESCSRCYTTHLFKTHSTLYTKDVVVDGEELLEVVVGWVLTVLDPDLHLGIVNAREVAGTGGLVLLWVKGKGVRVDSGVGVPGVVVEWLNLVEVLASLLLEAVLAVENELELVKGTNLKATNLCDGGRWSTLLSPAVQAEWCGGNERGVNPTD